MDTILITGGAGFIGSNLARELIKIGKRVIILDNLFTGFERNIPSGCEFINIDISDSKELSSLRVDSDIYAVYHLAAQSSGPASFKNPEMDINYNYGATLNILEFSKKHNVERFIFSSSMSVYGEVDKDNYIIEENHKNKPGSYYGSNKLASENTIRIFTHDSKIQPTIFRLFNVYGPGQNMNNMDQGMVSIYMSFLMKNQPVIVKGALDRFRDFIYIDDVVDIFIKALDNPESFNQIFNLGTGKKNTVKDLLEKLLKVYGKENFEEWVHVKGNTPGDIKGCIANMAKIKSILTWEPQYQLESGLKIMKEWVDETKEYWINA